MSDTNIIVGPHRIASTGPLTIMSEGAGVQIRSLTGDDGLQLDAKTNVSISSLPAMLNLSKDGEVLITPGKTGKLVQTVGLPLVGSVIKMEPTSITMSVGPPVVGASITLAPDSITLQIATTSIKLTALGITMQAVETSVKVTPVGVVTDAPMTKTNVDGVAMSSAGLEQASVQGILRDQASIRMVQ